MTDFQAPSPTGPARLLGAVGLAAGLASAARPVEVARFFGSFEGPRVLLGLIAARDLVLSAGLLAARDPRPWLRARALGDVMDIGLSAANALANRPPPARTATGLLVATAATVLDLAALRALETRR